MIDDDVSPPIIPSAVGQPRATHSDIVAIVELNCVLAASGARRGSLAARAVKKFMIDTYPNEMGGGRRFIDD